MIPNSEESSGYPGYDNACRQRPLSSSISVIKRTEDGTEGLLEEILFRVLA